MLRCLLPLLASAFLVGCASTQTDVYEDEYLPHTDDCQSRRDAKFCNKAAIVAEYHAHEAHKAGDNRAAARAFETAAASAQRSCDLGWPEACEYADRLRAKHDEF